MTRLNPVWINTLLNLNRVSPEHDQIESNLNFHLRAKLSGRNCRIFLANIRIKVPSAQPYRYADVSALCDQANFEEIGGIRAVANPAMIVEVLSPSTEAYDRGDKFTHYQSIPSFSEYLLVAQHRPHVTQLIKQADGSWLHNEYNDLTAVVRIGTLNCELPVSEIYEEVSFVDYQK